MAELFLGGTVDAATHERTGDDVRIGTDTFTTHGVIVGMTGSGKTGLGVVLIEEVLRAGLPALLIDPKGDLTNLCLSSGIYRRLPAVDRGRPARGRRVSTFASQPSQLWTCGPCGLGDRPATSPPASSTDFHLNPFSHRGAIHSARSVPAGTSDATNLDEEVTATDRGLRVGLLCLVGI